MVAPNPNWPYGPHYAIRPPQLVFSFAMGLKAAPIGAAQAVYRKLFRKAARLPNLGAGGTCYGLAYAVSGKAKRSRKPDLLLFCGNQSRVLEAHFRSSVFCSTHGTCVAKAGSLRKFVRELGQNASLQRHSECGTGTRNVVAARYGPTHAAVRSDNC